MIVWLGNRAAPGLQLLACSVDERHRVLVYRDPDDDAAGIMVCCSASCDRRRLDDVNQAARDYADSR